MKKELSLNAKNLIGSIICGLCWFVAGLFSNWNTWPCQLITAIALIGAGVSMVLAMVLHIEEGDEMSERHYLEAKALTYDVLIAVFLVFSIVGAGSRLFTHNDIMINWKSWMMFVGFMQFRSGIYFTRLEKDGDDAEA